MTDEQNPQQHAEVVEVTLHESELPESESSNEAPWNDPAVAEQMIKELRKESATYRTKAKELEPFAEKARELEESSKTEMQRILERAETAESEKGSVSAENARLRVALNKNVPLEVIESLGGSTVEEIEQRLDALLAWKESDKVTKPSKPVSNLRSAASGDEDTPLDLTDPRAMKKYLEQNS